MQNNAFKKQILINQNPPKIPQKSPNTQGDTIITSTSHINPLYNQPNSQHPLRFK